MHLKLYIQLSARVVVQHMVVAGPRGGVPHPGGGAPGGPRVPDQHQDQHILLGQGPQAQLQEEEVPDQAPPRGLRKWTLYCGQFSDISPHIIVTVAAALASLCNAAGQHFY